MESSCRRLSAVTEGVLIRRLVPALLSLLLAAAACSGEDTGVAGPQGGTAPVPTLDQDPVRTAAEAVLNLPADEVFALLDTLDDDVYATLIADSGVGGDVEFVEALDYDMASMLVRALDDDLLAGLSVVAEQGIDFSPADSAPPDSATSESFGPGADLRRVDGGALGRSGRLVVEVGPGDVSFLAFARAASPDTQVFITGVTSPSGVDVGDAVGLEYGELTNYGEAAFYGPATPRIDLEVGEYSIDFEATGDIVASGALVRSGSAGGLQMLDVVFWMATNEDYDPLELEDRFRRAGEAVLGPHEVAIGEMTFLDPPPGVIERYAVLDFTEASIEEDLRALCREMSASVGEVRALNFAIVDRLEAGTSEFVIEGSSSGLPGTAMLAGSDLSCVAGMAAPDPDDPGRDLAERAVVIWHEAGHHLGLYHTSEEDGLFFDLMDDTPECRYDERDTNDDGFIDLFECEGIDADNFMFYDGDGNTMTGDQAWTVRRHPLLYPAGG